MVVSDKSTLTPITAGNNHPDLLKLEVDRRWSIKFASIKALERVLKALHGMYYEMTGSHYRADLGETE